MLIRFFRSEPAAAVVLLVASAAAMLVANTPLYDTYHDVLHSVIGTITVHEWINDALMALFFLMVGLEIKREMVSGALATWGDRLLPGLAAMGGMIVPAILFIAVNRGVPDHHAGWAVPTATDIAFALGVLTLLGKRVPASIRVSLVGIAIIDDLLAILVIAIFYSEGISISWLSIGVVLAVMLFVLNKRSVHAIWPYLLIGIGLWIAIFNSGLHATLAGVIVAISVPSRGVSDRSPAPLNVLEHRLIYWVNFGILPLFGFANAGVNLSGMRLADVTDTLPLGIILGLFIGKQIGIFTTIWLLVKAGVARMPARTTWRQIHAMSILCGIGFTMSIFIAGLAFAANPHYLDMAKIGVITGSLISAVIGTMLMRSTTSSVTDLEGREVTMPSSPRPVAE
ncbi:MAG: Na+/H+ antiporter NhaA [Thermomicrobiales bacterium]|nr:Na+/H+ antiporter NhaA [Thermomicrobiales bacterium]MCO5228376.1 Na+/H+ antiporter NhaA [Thermomicrobiales bacterium]